LCHVKDHGLSLVLGVAITLALLATACTSYDSFEGTEITSRDPAPDFRLTDQFGRPVTLDEISGEVVALTFLYTNCPDTCPLATQTLRQAYDALGDYATRVKFVAISVDPARDTPERTHAYSVQWDMLDKWTFLTGSEEDMEPVWRSYYVAAQRQEPQSGKSTLEHFDQELAPKAVSEKENLPATAAYLIGHSAPVYLMDRDRKMRIVFTSLTLDPGPLVRDIKRLLE
jgi:cytochrome oxidase Cu insertion factor (SCO1/SenC/PrrC family)